MQKDKWKTIRDILVGNCKIVFPVLAVVLGAVTVVIALNANKAEAQTQADGQSQQEIQESGIASGDVDSSEEDLPEESEVQAETVPLVANEDGNIYTLVATYYNAIGTGDMATLQSICHGISENTLLYYEELSGYIDHYSDIEIFTKQGPVEGTAIAYVYYKMGLEDKDECPGYEALYVCTEEDGSLYIKDNSLFTEEEKQYIRTANGQVDVLELDTRVAAEYSELIERDPSLLEYASLVKTQVNTKVGETLASRVQSEEPQTPEGTEQPAGEGGQMPVGAQEPVPEGPKYASSTTTVNVRSSDSEQADKLGKVSRGTRLEVQEVRLNGWTKVLYEGQDGYIKSEYLQFEENTADLQVIGTVTATTNLNVRVSASETAERLGVLAGGSSLELLANENGWCKVNYNGQVGYVKADYVTQQ